jgi:hypothetical protein
VNDPIPGGSPVPAFTLPTVPHAQPAGDVTIALSADIAYVPKYTLTVKFNGNAVAAPANLTAPNGGNVPTNAIDIPTTGTGNLKIPAAYINTHGPGLYTLVITANNNPGLPGTGTATVDFTINP